ncbi:TadE/TadG family type IV pilus assembly protein [Salinarimonas rosea]|uniref:TadE/TadG family type IV pilus assembly protein n=1 Tax=Salinarimonas rosea TaxID=552063 RepID=UPI0004035C5C|nr:TadE/TadG family type IV pilus assembly protein [Salinarimonas rosea]
MRASSLRHFLRDRRGVVAVAFALSLLPALGVTGAGIDYARTATIASALQAEADAFALSGHDAADRDAVESAARQAILARLGDAVHGLSVETRTVPRAGGVTEHEVTVSARVPLRIVSVVPGMPDDLRVEAVAVARALTRVVTPEPPLVQLSHEAADYNQIYAYCFDPARNGLGNGVGAEGQRSKMTLIADNGGSDIAYRMPVCAEGESLSLRLRNVRNARTRPQKWNDPAAEQYDYYSDTTITPGNAVKLNFPKDADVAETVFCATLDVCHDGAGGVLPRGKHRNPHAANKPCREGAFLFYGFEDRPSPRFRGDSDFDDIRIILGCSVTTEEAELVLVR